MRKYVIEGDTLLGVANAIRNKTGEVDAIPVIDMAAKINGIEAISFPIDDRFVKLTSVLIFSQPGTIVYYAEYTNGNICYKSCECTGSIELTNVFTYIPICMVFPSEQPNVYTEGYHAGMYGLSLIAEYNDEFEYCLIITDETQL